MIRTLRFLLPAVVVLMGSCKVTEEELIGKYHLNKFPKTTIQIKQDKSFEFVKNNPNPYLHPFEHPEENYFITKGTWEIADKNKIILNSQNDSLTYPLGEVKKEKAKNQSTSDFIFLDTDGDIVKILYVQYPSGEVSMAFHSSMSSFSQDLTKKDSLEFYFYGYRHFTFIGEERENADYTIKLTPEFKPNYFLQTEFVFRKNKILDVKKKAKFLKKKSTM